MTEMILLTLLICASFRHISQHLVQLFYHGLGGLLFLFSYSHNFSSNAPFGMGYV